MITSANQCVVVVDHATFPELVSTRQRSNSHHLPLSPSLCLSAVIAKIFRQADTEESGNVATSVVPSLAGKVLGPTAKASDLQLIQYWVGQREGSPERERERSCLIFPQGWHAMELIHTGLFPSSFNDPFILPLSLSPSLPLRRWHDVICGVPGADGRCDVSDHTLGQPGHEAQWLRGVRHHPGADQEEVHQTRLRAEPHGRR